MRIALIDITNLVRMRDAFDTRWRVFTAAAFLLSAAFWWWLLLTRPRSEAGLVDQALTARTLLLAAAVLLPLAFALSRKNDFSRLFFALMLAVNFVTLSVLILVGIALAGPLPDELNRATGFLILISLLVVLTIYEKYLIRPFYVLLISLLPFGPWEAFRRQVLLCLRLWSGEWKSAEGARSVGGGETPYLNRGAPYRMALGWFWFAVGTACFFAALYGFVNEEFLPAVGRLEFSEAWHMVSRLQTTELGRGRVPFQQHAVRCALLFALAFPCYFVYGYFLTQWRREHVTVYRVPLMEHMTASDLLLLRSFDDDVKFVSRRGSANSSPPYKRVYGWSYTFEQLIVDRLKYLGQVRLLDFEEKREGLLSKRGVRLLARALGRDRLKKFLIAVFPAVWYRLPAQGGVRYYVSADRKRKEWQDEVEKAMLLARVIVLMLGETDGLDWEMRRVGDSDLSHKTLFVMPPLLPKWWHYRARWERFADAVCDPASDERRLLLEKVDPKRVLVATPHGDALVIITGRGTSQPFYEAALDVASLLAVADPAESVRMIRKYLR
ncbi:MAG TPA: hypothetical protein VN282_23110 [Pyrinomonadaceae bacterium]|nr:hypothetical protein [Pyrinomonadaceae bacterium]